MFMVFTKTCNAPASPFQSNKDNTVYEVERQRNRRGDSILVVRVNRT